MPSLIGISRQVFEVAVSQASESTEQGAAAEL